MVLGKTHGLAVQRETQRLAGKVLAERPVAGLQENSQQRLVAAEHVAVWLDELVMPIGHHRIAPVDDPYQETFLDQHVIGDEVAVAEDAVERREPGEIRVDLRNQMRRQRTMLSGRRYVDRRT